MNTQDQTPCKHIKFEIRNSDMQGFVHCLDCGASVRIWIAFNNLADEMHRVLEEAKGVVQNLNRGVT